MNKRESIPTKHTLCTYLQYWFVSALDAKTRDSLILNYVQGSEGSLMNFKCGRKSRLLQYPHKCQFCFDDLRFVWVFLYVFLRRKDILTSLKM